MKTWSWSRYGRANHCALSYWLQYTQRVPMEVPSFLEAGRQNHKVLEDFMTDILASKADNTFIAQELQTEYAGKMADIYPGSEPRLAGSLAWAAENVPLPRIGEIALLEQKVLLPDESAVGYVDYAVKGPDSLSVNDWKTGWKMQEDALNQCRWYAYMMLREEPEWRPSSIHLGVIYPLLGKTMEAVETWEEVNAFGANVEGLMNEYRYLDEATTAPEPNITEKCSTCFVRRSCPAYNDFLDSGDFQNPAEAWALRAALKDKLSRVELFIKGELASNGGPITVKGGQIELQEVEAWKFPAKEVWGLLKQMGLPSEDFLSKLSVSGTIMKKLVPDEDEYVSVQESIGKKTVSKRLKLWKV